MNHNNDIVEANFSSKDINNQAQHSNKPVLKIKCNSETEMIVYRGASHNLTVTLAKVMMSNAH